MLIAAVFSVPGATDVGWVGGGPCDEDEPPVVGFAGGWLEAEPAGSAEPLGDEVGGGSWVWLIAGGETS